MVYFSVSAYLLTLWSYGLNFSGGVLIPGLCAGAAWGRLVGLGVLHFFPNTVRHNIIFRKQNKQFLFLIFKKISVISNNYMINYNF